LPLEIDAPILSRPQGAIREVGMGAEGNNQVRSEARWIGDPRRPAMAWFSLPATGRPVSGVVVVPAVGYQWWSTHRTQRVLAEQLAAQGHLVVRIDLDGTGDSAGEATDPGRLRAWRLSIAAAVAQLRASGCETVSVVGTRLGGTLALLDGARHGADAIALWAPVVSGRRWARELRMLGEALPDGDGVATAGVVFSEATLAELGGLSATDVAAAPAARVLVVDAQPDAKLVAHLRALDGVVVDTRAVEGGERALDVPTEEATVPEAVVDAIAGWLGTAPARGDDDLAERTDAPPAHAHAAAIPWRGGVVKEAVRRVGGLIAIETAPEAPATGATLVFLNTGSEPHVGPGRAWVELTRTLALAGLVCVRADWRGWGESPDADRAPGRPYDPHTVTDTITLVESLRAAGHRDVVLVGLCASAWVALRAVLAVGSDALAGVIAINPQLYWQPGDPVEALLTDTRRRRAEEIAAIEDGAASGRWDAEDAAGARPWAATWLDALAAADIPITMLFAEGDDGLRFLQTRHAARLAAAQASGTVVVAELPEIDHALHRAWTRGRVAEAIAGAAAGVAAAAAAGVSARRVETAGPAVPRAV
jgi:alpha-beta hydrolase superfamily lysophospholipase